MNVQFRSQLLVFALACSPLWGQVRKLHTRDMTRLSQVQVADYLKRSDIIFIPVGAVETNGIMPSDRDYVSPLAYAMTMADELDAIYMPGLIIDLPVKGDYGEAESSAAGPVPENTGLAGLSKLGYAGSLSLGSWVPDVMAHGGGREPVLPATAAEREEWGKQGQAQIIAVVKQMRLREAMDDLKKHDEYTNKVLVPKFGRILPGSR